LASANLRMELSKNRLEVQQACMIISSEVTDLSSLSQTVIHLLESLRFLHPVKRCLPEKEEENMVRHITIVSTRSPSVRLKHDCAQWAL